MVALKASKNTFAVYAIDGGRRMNPTEYDRMVDLLLQIRGKIPVAGTLRTNTAAYRADVIRNLIDNLITNIDDFANMDQLGYVK